MTATTTPKANAKRLAAATPKAQPKTAKDAGQRTCAARPQGPYGIDARKKCTNPTIRPNAALCKEHEALWRAEARRRHAARRAVADAAPKARSRKTPAERPDELAGQLASSVAAFATPELAAKAKAKRDAQRGRRS